MREVDLFAKLEEEVFKTYLENSDGSKYIPKHEILKAKMDDDYSRAQTVSSSINQRRTKSTSGLTADDLCGNLNYTTTLPRSRKSSQSDNKNPVGRVPLNDSNMGSTLSKKLNDRGRKQRSAAERLVDSRKQARNGGNQSASASSQRPQRSRSVGDRLGNKDDQIDRNKSMENIPIEIRQQFNPLFSQELNKIVRQKSKRRELMGFTDPDSDKINDDDFKSTLDSLSRNNHSKSKSISSSSPHSSAVNHPVNGNTTVVNHSDVASLNGSSYGSLQNGLNSKLTSSHKSLNSTQSAFDSLYGGGADYSNQQINKQVKSMMGRSKTMPKPPRSKSTSSTTSNPRMDPPSSKQLSQEFNFSGTNNSSSAFVRAKADTSQESLYDNVDIGRPTKRTDQPPPKLENGQILGKDLKSATAMLRNRYSNIPQPARQKSDISARSDHPVRQPTQQRPPLQQQLPRSLQTTNNNNFKPMPQIKSMANNDNGRLMVSGQTPMLHCRNTNCNQIAPLEHAQQHYKSCVHCFTYYCCGECRQEHWPKHKEKCIYARAVSTTKSILRSIFQSQHILNELAIFAKQSYSAHDRGALQIIFSSLNNGLIFLQKCQLSALEKNPVYVKPEKLDQDMRNLIGNYQPKFEFVLDIKILISPKERLLYNRPYKTMVNHVSTAARLPLRIIDHGTAPEMII